MGRYFNDFNESNDYLEHYGRKGMKWGKNIFDKAVDVVRSNRALNISRGPYKIKSNAKTVGDIYARGANRIARNGYGAEQELADEAIWARGDVLRYQQDKRSTGGKYNLDSASERGRAKRKAEQYIVGSRAEKARKARADYNSEQSEKDTLKRIFEKMAEYKNDEGKIDMQRFLNRISDEERATLLSVLKNSKIKGE